MFYAEVFSCLFFEGRSRETKHVAGTLSHDTLTKKTETERYKTEQKSCCKCTFGRSASSRYKNLFKFKAKGDRAQMTKSRMAQC